MFLGSSRRSDDVLSAMVDLLTTKRDYFQHELTRLLNLLPNYGDPSYLAKGIQDNQNTVEAYNIAINAVLAEYAEGLIQKAEEEAKRII